MNKRLMCNFHFVLVVCTSIMVVSASSLAQATPLMNQHQQAISIVNGEEISIVTYQERCRFNRWLVALTIRDAYESGDYSVTELQSMSEYLLYLLRNPEISGGIILDSMEQELILGQVAKAYNVVIDRAQVDELLSQNLTNIAGVNSLDEFYQKAEEADISHETIQEAYYYSALREEIFSIITAGISTEEVQIRSRYILISFNPSNPWDVISVSDEQRAIALVRVKVIMKLLQFGGSFPALARMFSDDKPSAQNGGELPWMGADSYLLWESVKDAPVGTIIGPVETEDGYHIIEILERDIRPVDSYVLIQRQQEMFTEWLEAQITKSVIERRADWTEYIPTTPTYEELLGDIMPLQQPSPHFAPELSKIGIILFRRELVRNVG